MQRIVIGSGRERSASRIRRGIELRMQRGTRARRSPETRRRTAIRHSGQIDDESRRSCEILRGDRPVENANRHAVGEVGGDFQKVSQPARESAVTRPPSRPEERGRGPAVTVGSAPHWSAVAGARRPPRARVRRSSSYSEPRPVPTERRVMPEPRPTRREPADEGSRHGRGGGRPPDGCRAFDDRRSGRLVRGVQEGRVRRHHDPGSVRVLVERRLRDLSLPERRPAPRSFGGEGANGAGGDALPFSRRASQHPRQDGGHPDRRRSCSQSPCHRPSRPGGTL